VTRRIFRARDRKKYLIVEQAAVEDSRLSWAARGLLVYLLAKPDTWQVIVNDLIKRGDLGRDGVYGLLKELREHDYVRYERHRDPDGRLRGGHYLVFERPPSLESAPHPDSPETVRPEPVPPEPASPDALSITYPEQEPISIQLPRFTSHKTDQKKSLATGAYAFPPTVSPQERASASCIVASLDPDARQAVLDEWGQAIARGAIRSSPLGYLDAIVKRRLAEAKNVDRACRNFL